MADIAGSGEAAELWTWPLLISEGNGWSNRRNFSSPYEPPSTCKLSFFVFPCCFQYFILFWLCTLFEVTIATCHQLVSHSNVGILGSKLPPEVGCFPPSAISSLPLTPGEGGLHGQQPCPSPPPLCLFFKAGQTGSLFPVHGTLQGSSLPKVCLH